MTVTVTLPGQLAELAGGARQLRLDPGTVGDLLDRLAELHPVLERRIRDESGRLRRFVNVFVDGEEIRGLAEQATAVPDGAQVHVLPSVAGGA